MAVTKIFVKNYIDDVLTAATSVVMSDPGGTYGIRLKSDGTVKVTDGTAITTNPSTGVYEYGSAASPISDMAWYDAAETYEYAFQVNQADGDIDYATGEILPTDDNPDFSDIYGIVKTNVGNILGTTEAKRLVNQALRVVANDRDWDWVTEETVYSLSLTQATEQYVLPITVNQILSAYSSTRSQLPIVDVGHAGLFNLGDRIQGDTNLLIVLGNNVVMPDPVPSASDTIYLHYRKLFHLAADSDVFPCNRDFIDCIEAHASWKGNHRHSKPERAEAFKEDYLEMLHNLRISRIHRRHYTFGDSGYSLHKR